MNGNNYNSGNNFQNNTPNNGNFSNYNNGNNFPNNMPNNGNNFSNNQPNMNYNQNNNPNNKNKLIMGVMAIIIVILLAVILFKKDDSQELNNNTNNNNTNQSINTNNNNDNDNTTNNDSNNKSNDSESSSNSSSIDFRKKVEEEQENIKNNIIIKDKKMTQQLGVFLEYKNNNNMDVNISVSADYYDSNNNFMVTRSSLGINIPANGTAYYYIEGPIGEDFSSYKLKLDFAGRSSFKNNSNSVKILSDSIVDGDFEVKVKNTGSSRIGNADIFIIFYDSNNEVAGMKSYGTSSINPNEEKTVKIGVPVGTNGKSINYSKYDISFNYAYEY